MALQVKVLARPSDQSWIPRTHGKVEGESDGTSCRLTATRVLQHEFPPPVHIRHGLHPINSLKKFLEWAVKSLRQHRDPDMARSIILATKAGNKITFESGAQWVKCLPCKHEDLPEFDLKNTCKKKIQHRCTQS